MKGKSPDSSQTSFLMSGLSEQLNPRHPIYQLSKVINWESLEADFTRLYSRRGRPAKAVRLMISLLLLKQLHDLSDDQVVERWVEKIPIGSFSAESMNFSGPRRLLHRISHISASVLVKRALRDY
jgi:IS5 family transposase